MKFTRSPLGKSLLPVMSAALLMDSTPAVAAEKSKPNIVFIFADDHGYPDVGAYGNKEVRTPNIDRLAARGVHFERAYNMGSWTPAVCVASRTMLNTGLAVWPAQRAMNHRTSAGPDSLPVWSELMRDAGYATYFTGKWHVDGLGVHSVFNHVVNVRPGMPNVHMNNKPHAYNRPVEGQEDAWNPADPAEGGFWEGGEHWSEVLADDSIRFIRQAATRSEPFFMYLAFNAPHDPRQAPQEYLDSYDADQIEIPENFLPAYPYANPMQSPPQLRDEFLMPFPRTEYAVRVHRKEFYAIITHMDTQIGRILDELEESGKLDNTIIIFTADHGLAVGQHGLVGKQNMYEHSLRVPFILAGPGIPVGESRQAPIYFQDIMPTTLEWAGARIPDHVLYQSIRPILHEQDRSRYPAIYGAYLGGQRAVIHGDYKLIVYPRANVMRYFNISEDPLEMNDLAGMAESQPIMRRLFNQLEKLQRDMEDPLDLRDFESYL